MKLQFTKAWLDAESPIKMEFDFFGVTLKLNKPWLNAQSPLKLEFDKGEFYGITLRFDTPWLNATSPLKLRFGGDEPVKPPIKDGAIGVDVTLAHDDGDYTGIDLVMLERGTPVGYRFDWAWETPVSVQTINSLVWVSNPDKHSEHTISWSGVTQIRVDTTISWDTPPSVEMSPVNITWATHRTHEISVTAPWVRSDVHHIVTSVNWVGNPDDGIEATIAFSSYDIRGDEITLKWGFREPRWVCSTRYRPPAVGPFSITFNGDPYTPNDSKVTLRFTQSPKYCYWDDGGGLVDSNPDLPNLDFKIPIEPQIKRVYLMEPTLTCTRVSDNLPIVINSASIGDRRGQHSKSVSIEFSSKIDMLHAENELLLIGINGYEFYAIAENPNKRESFGKATYSATGRSRSALLSAPWMLPISYTNTTSKSFAGLLNDIVKNTGWTVQLEGIADFNVPAGAYSSIGKTPIEAIADAARQVGCMTVIDEFTSIIKVVPQYPTTPWNMDGATPDVIIHDAVILDYNSRKEIRKLCNGVWVRGEQQGISARIRRIGTAADITTPDISSQLIVDVKAARVVGTTAIADTGNKDMITVNLPIMHDLPPLTKGMLVGVTYRTEVFKVTCDSVSISASVSNSGVIDVNQSVTLIRHLE